MARHVVRGLACVVLLALLALPPGAATGLGVRADGAGTTFTSPTYGSALTYDASWVVPPNPPRHDANTLLLTNGVSTLAATANLTVTLDATSCVAEARNTLTQAAGVGNVQAAGQQPPNTAASQAGSVDTLTVTPTTGAPVTLTLYLQCDKVAGGDAAFLLEAITPQDAAATQGPPIAALFAGEHAAPKPTLAAAIPSVVLTPAGASECGPAPRATARRVARARRCAPPTRGAGRPAPRPGSPNGRGVRPRGRHTSP